MTHTKDEALKLALDALEDMHIVDFSLENLAGWNKAITTIKQALAAQPAVQEPVAQLGDGVLWCDTCRSVQDTIHHTDPNDGDVWCKGEAKWLQGPFYTTAAPDLQAELDATNRQVEILSDALTESRREVAALKAVQEPVGNWVWSWLMDWCKRNGIAPATRDSLFAMVKDARNKFEATPLTAQPAAQEFTCSTSLCHYKAQRQWVGLTDEEFIDLCEEASNFGTGGLIRHIEAKLKEKNQ
jgi:hypothetical protein